MKPTIRVPYFEIGTKNYVWGDKLLEYAIAADKAAEKYDIDVLFIVPALEVRRVAENTKNLKVFCTYMDTLRPGRGCADILPEGVKDAGAIGVMINHCEKPMSLPQMKLTIDRARELDMLVFACADTLAEAKAIAQLGPDIINPEPSEIIGGGHQGSGSHHHGGAGRRHHQRPAGLRFHHGWLRSRRRRLRHHERRRSHRHDRRNDRRHPPGR